MLSDVGLLDSDGEVAAGGVHSQDPETVASRNLAKSKGGCRGIEIRRTQKEYPPDPAMQSDPESGAEFMQIFLGLT